MKVYGDKRSGNCYKVQLILELLHFDYQWIEVDIAQGETQTPAFLSLNPNGKIPLLQLDDGRCLSESNAIISYLAENTPYLPKNSFERALVNQWLFFEQYSHEPFIAVARFICVYQNKPQSRMDEYQGLFVPGYKALDVMEKQLLITPYLVGDTPSVADVALFAYTHVADEGGFDLTQYPAIQRWIEQVTSWQGFVRLGV